MSKLQLIQGDCLIKLKELDDNSIDSIVTDPPYHLVSIVKRFGKENSAPAKFGTDGAFSRASKGFMGKNWDGVNEDGIGIAQKVELWKECLRVLKPGGYLLAFGGTRTYHRMASAIEDAGFEVRDMIEWVYSTGFPKSLNVFKVLAKKCSCGNMEAYENRIKQNGTSSEQEAEYFLRFMQQADLSQTISSKKEQGEVLQSSLSEQSVSLSRHSTENLRRKEPFLEGRTNTEKTEGELQRSDLSEMSEGISTNGEKRWLYNATQISDGSTPEQTTNENGSSTPHRPQSEQQQYREPCAFCKQWGTQAIRTLGVGTATKPAHEPICMARKPLAEKTVAENCLKYGTGGINIDASRVPTSDKYNYPNGAGGNSFSVGEEPDGKRTEPVESNNLGRFPANIIHDNSEEVRECFPETKTGSIKPHKNAGSWKNCSDYIDANFTGDSGNASRFFKSIVYIPKASKSERNMGCEGLETSEKFTAGNYSQSPTCKDCNLTLNGTNDHSKCSGEVYYKEMESKNTKNNHPTVKPVALMEYLIKMVTPKGGIVLDPFMGSGTTGIACRKLNYGFIGIELEEDYITIAKARINSIKAVQEKLL